MELSEVSIAELQAEILRRKKLAASKGIFEKIKSYMGNPFGTWKVTTEGDCEGRSIKTIGVFEGHIVDIALELGQQGGYSLSFEPFILKNLASPVRVEKIEVSFPIQTGTWEKGVEYDEAVEKWLKTMKPENKFQVERCTYHSAYTIRRLEE